MVGAEGLAYPLCDRRLAHSRHPQDGNVASSLIVRPNSYGNPRSLHRAELVVVVAERSLKAPGGVDGVVGFREVGDAPYERPFRMPNQMSYCLGYHGLGSGPSRTRQA